MKVLDAERRIVFLIAASAAVAVLPLIVHGPSYGHDFNFHLLNWMEAARQFSHGTLYPRWAFSPAYNAGEPRFVFYPPASWMLGALVGLVLTHIPGLRPEIAWTATPIVFTWICLTTSGLTMFWAARKFASSRAAVFAAVLYCVNPYMLFTAYERTAFAELLAAAWVPLLLWALLAPEIRATRVAVPIALLWLTNAPAAVIGCYATLLLVIFRVATRLVGTDIRRGSVVLAAVVPAGVGTLLGSGLAGFYFIPAAWERRFVQVSMATIVNMRVDHNFLFERTGNSLDAVTHDDVLHTASWVAVSLLAAAGATLLACWKQRRTPPGRHPLPIVPLMLSLAVVAFLLTGWSNPVWQHAPELKFLQFPWRLLMVVAPVFVLALAVAVSEVRVSNAVVVFTLSACALLLTISAYRSFHQVPEPGQTVASRLQVFIGGEGAEPTDEYTPQTADNDALVPGNPPYWLASAATAPAPTQTTPRPVSFHFNVEARRPEFMILNLRDYPAWRIFLNSRIIAERDERDDGLIAFPVPAGTSTIDIRYVRGFDDLAGDGVSVVSLLAIAAASLRKRALAVSA